MKTSLDGLKSSLDITEEKSCEWGNSTKELSTPKHKEKKSWKENEQRNSLAVQWLGFCASTAGSMDLIPGWGTKIPQACSVAKKKKKRK